MLYSMVYSTLAHLIIKLFVWSSCSITYWSYHTKVAAVVQVYGSQ